jgi:hypothetical protein
LECADLGGALDFSPGGVAQKVVGHEVMGERWRGTEPRAVASGIKMLLFTDEFFYWPNGDSLSRSLPLAVL